MNVEPDQLRIECDTRRGQLLLVALVAVSGRGDRHQIPQVADPPMTMCDQLRDTLPGSGLVIRQDAVRIEEGRRAVDEDHRRASATLAQQIAVVVACRDDDEAVDASRGEGGDELLFTGFVLIGASGEDQDTASKRDVFDFAVQRRGEGVGDILEEDADRGRLPVGPPQTAGRVVMPVIEPLDRANDPRSDIVRDGRFGIDHPRDGLQADPS